MFERTQDTAMLEPASGTAIDVAGARRPEGFLRNGSAFQMSNEALSVTLNSVSDAVIITDGEGRATILNSLAGRLTGWTLQDAAGRPVEEIFQIIHQDTRCPSALPVKETLARGTVQGLASHTIISALNGSECAIAGCCAPIRGRDGQVTGAVIVFHDAMGEYVSQQAIRDNAALIQAILNTVADGIITFHADDGIIETVNPAAEQIFGYAAKELIGQNCMMLMPDRDRDRHNSFHEYYSTGEEPYTVGLGREVTGRRKDGSIFPMEVAMSEMRLHGQRHYTGIFRDITERRYMDKVLHENYVELKKAISVAEKANLAKSEFLSRMSHELRTPLNAILGFAQLLESGSPQPTDAQAERLQQITKAGWYLLDLINEILDLAVIESGKLSLSPEPVSLAEVIHECHEMIESQAQKRGIQLIFRPVPEALFANADRTRVKQVLINLLSNAIKYNSLHGTVEVECTASTPERIRVSIKDTGAGLSPRMLSQLFQPFNRLGQENGIEEGTGMGLVVAKQLVELMGGSIGVNSAVGKGSEFWIELARDLLAPQHAAGAVVPAEIAARALKYSSPRTLLYVEDNPANLMLVEQIIESHPHVSMLSARDAHLGIALARAHVPDVILMDINLPGISGIEALKILREDPSTKHIPVLALSANAMPRDIERGLEAGFFRYLTKPVKVNEFTGALDDALNFSRVGFFNESRTGRLK